MSEYAERDLLALDRAGNYYSRHVSAMTSEGLHSKSDIAAELGARDARIAELEKWQRDMVNKAAEKGLDGYRELGQRAAKAETERDALRETARLAERFAKAKGRHHSQHAMCDLLEHFGLPCTRPGEDHD